MARRKATDELTVTVNAMYDSAIAAGLDVPEIPEVVNEPTETVTETAEIVDDKAETDIKNAEIVNDSLPLAINLELKTLSLVQKFSWNFDEIKTDLAGRITRYAGLVVTEENLKDMEKAQKEIASLRTRIGKFRAQVKRDLEKPYNDFELQIKELNGLVESVEKPIKDQLEIYETKRRNAKEAEIQASISEISAQLGLEGKYSQQIVVDSKWLNRTATKKEITEGIQERVCWFLDIQAKDHQAALFAAQKTEMAKLLCQSLSAGLVTPLTYEDIEPRIAHMNDILAVKTYIEGEVARRRELEARAAEQAAAVPTDGVSPDYDNNFVHDYEPTPPPLPPANGAPPMPPMYLPPVNPPLPPMAPVERWDCDMHIYAVTVDQMEELKAVMRAIGIQYDITGHRRVL